LKFIDTSYLTILKIFDLFHFDGRLNVVEELIMTGGSKDFKRSDLLEKFTVITQIFPHLQICHIIFQDRRKILPDVIEELRLRLLDVPKVVFKARCKNILPENA
jgi:hypothetical protein